MVLSQYSNYTLMKFREDADFCLFNSHLHRDSLIYFKYLCTVHNTSRPVLLAQLLELHRLSTVQSTEEG